MISNEGDSDMNSKEIADNIYDDLKQNVIEWAEVNGQLRHSPNGGYTEYPIRPSDYIDELVDEVARQLYDKFYDDEQLNNILYETF